MKLACQLLIENLKSKKIDNNILFKRSNTNVQKYFHFILKSTDWKKTGINSPTFLSKQLKADKSDDI